MRQSLVSVGEQASLAFPGSKPKDRCSRDVAPISECEEDILNPRPSDGAEGDIYATTDSFIFYEPLLYEGELEVLPSESKDDRDNMIFLYLFNEVEGKYPTYAFRNLIDISFTVEGIKDEAAVWLIRPHVSYPLLRCLLDSSILINWIRPFWGCLVYFCILLYF